MEFTLAVISIVLLAATHSGAALECYHCNSKSDASCSDPEKLDSFKMECNSKAVDEAKKAFNSVSHTISDWGSMVGLNIGKTTTDSEIVCQKTEIENKDQTYIVRSCSIGGKESDNMCDWLKSKLNTETVKVKHCSQCKDKLCNSSNGIAPTLFTVFIALAAVLFYKQ